MRNVIKDPLLSVAQGALIDVRISIGIIVLGCFFMIPVFILAGDKIGSFYAEHNHIAVPGFFGLRGVADLIYGLAGAVVMERFLALLTEIAQSAGHGDPFHSGNAKSLNRMGWLLLIFHMLGIPVFFLTRGLLKTETAQSPMSLLYIPDVLMVLTLFILSRVFAAGSAMRADLEGTI